MQSFTIPTNQEFLDESLISIDLCDKYCTCSDNWHFLWSSMKASGLRRGIYYQYNQLQSISQIQCKKPQRILIAGAADSGSLHILSSIFANDNVQFTIIDKCRAPLEQIKMFARSHNLSNVRTIHGDIENHAEDIPWDVIFIHNTLILMDKKSRIAAINNLSRQLAHGGIILCNARYNSGKIPTSNNIQSLIQQETTEILNRLRETYLHHPEILMKIEPLVFTYVSHTCQSIPNRPTQLEFIEDIKSSNMKIIQRYPEINVMPTRIIDKNNQITTLAELLLLAN